MKPGWTVGISVVCTFLAAGVLYLAISPPRGETITLRPAPTPPPLVVQVSGAVAQPGLYNLPAGSRVKDALDAAGGYTAEADLRLLNLASFIQDGERIDVPAQNAGRSPGTAAPGDDWQSEMNSRGSGGAFTPDPQTTSSPGFVNINRATQAELESLPGIGPSLAQRIIVYREQNGPFKTIEDIQKVTGIGPKIFEKIKDLITTKP